MTKVTDNPDEFAFIDADGTLYLPGATTNVKDAEHFARAMKGETVTIDPVGSKSPGVEGTPIVLTATPVKDEAGNMILHFFVVDDPYSRIDCWQQQIQWQVAALCFTPETLQYRWF